MYEQEKYNAEWKKNVDGILVLNIITLVLVLVPIIADNNTLLKFWSITSLTCVLICANTQIKTHQTYCWTRRSCCQHWWKYSVFMISWICTVFVVGIYRYLLINLYDCICTIDNKCVNVPYMYVEHEFWEMITVAVLC